jgi:hypothetical protein
MPTTRLNLQPRNLTFVFGEVPIFVVRGREKRPAAA